MFYKASRAEWHKGWTVVGCHSPSGFLPLSGLKHCLLDTRYVNGWQFSVESLFPVIVLGQGEPSHSKLCSLLMLLISGDWLIWQ